MLLAVALAACAGAPSATPSAAPSHRAATRVLSIIGTNDIHGRVESVAWLAGFVSNLRARRADDGGDVLVVDAGDAFQGTLESNLGEGVAMIDAFDALGVAAMAVGNHEFDFGPVGPSASPRSESDDPRGALFARATQGRVRLLAANIIDVRRARPFGEPTIPSSVLVATRVGPVGVVGVATMETRETTLAANVVDLALTPIAATVEREARALRARGARAVVVLAHAGASCERVDEPTDLTSCEDHEIFAVARALPRGLVDVIVAGHTHAAVAHEVNEIPIIESHAHGRAFGRVDLVVDAERVIERRLFAPTMLCDGREATIHGCEATYEGRAVSAEPRVVSALAPHLERARAQRERPLGVTLIEPVRRAYDTPSALGSRMVEWMLAAAPAADVAITNGGALRADLPAGALTYGALFEAFPFDNRLVTLLVEASALEAGLGLAVMRGRSWMSIAGLRGEFRCDAGAPRVALFDRTGARVAPSEHLTVATSDFLATGGDGVFASVRGAPVEVVHDEPLRDVFARELATSGARALSALPTPVIVGGITVPPDAVAACRAARP